MGRIVVTPDNAIRLASIIRAKCKATEWLTITDAAQLLGCHHKTAYAIVLTLIEGGFLEVQDGWKDNELIRFRLCAYLRK